MAKVKAKWVGQVTLEWEWDEDESFIANHFEDMKSEVDDYGNKLLWMLRGLYEYIEPGPDITVKQLHAELRRDDPVEWVKEEAT